MINVLVLGATGFIGSNVVSSLSKHKKFKLLTPSTVECDLRKKESVEKYIKLERPNIIINAAFYGVSAKIPFSTEYITKNLNMVINILSACRGVRSIKKIIHLGSCNEYGDSKNPISEYSPLAPKNVYGTAKAVCSLAALEFAREYSLPLVILRVFYLYGPNDERSVLYYLANSIANKKKASLTAGEQLRDYMYVKDLAEVINKICKKPEVLNNMEIYNIGRGQGTNLAHVFKLIYKSFGEEPDFDSRKYSEYEYMSQVADIRKIKKAVKKIKFTPLKVGIKNTINEVFIKRPS